MDPVVKMQLIQWQILISLSPGSTPFISSPPPPPPGVTYNASIICSTYFTYHTNINKIDTVYSPKIDREF